MEELRGSVNAKLLQNVARKIGTETESRTMESERIAVTAATSTYNCLICNSNGRRAVERDLRGGAEFSATKLKGCLLDTNLKAPSQWVCS